jgi:hypothetical protein
LREQVLAVNKHPVLGAPDHPPLGLVGVLTWQKLEGILSSQGFVSKGWRLLRPSRLQKTHQNLHPRRTMLS